MSDDDPCEQAGELLRGAERVVVLTGAGISTESGIPDFRSPGGLWDRFDPSELTYDRFLESAETRKIYWEIATESYPVMRDAQPNAAHQAVVRLEECGKLLCLVTQNVDGLHQRAGSSDAVTIEIHGSAMRAKCVDCGAEHDRAELHERVLGGDIAPACDHCGGRLKPATVSFGQAMPEKETREAFAAASDCDLMLVIGSSLVVYPAAAVPELAVRSGAPLVIVNREPTALASIATFNVYGAAGETMTRILAQAGMEVGE